MYGEYCRFGAWSKLPAQQFYLGDVDRGVTSEYGYNNGQADCGFGCGDTQREKDQNLSVYVTKERAEGYQREVYRIEHKLHAHKDDNRVFPGKYADSSNGKKHGTKGQEPG
jgi:hypothetical protein